MKAKTKLMIERLLSEYGQISQLLIAIKEGGNEPTKKGVLFWSECEDVGVKKGKDCSVWVFNSEGWRAKILDERVVWILDELLASRPSSVGLCDRTCPA